MSRTDFQHMRSSIQLHHIESKYIYIDTHYGILERC